MAFLKTHFKALIVSFLLLALLVCLCPFPQRVYLKASGTEVDVSALKDNGQIVPTEDCLVKVNGWHYRFLLLDDFLNLSVSTDGESGVHTFELEDISNPFSYWYEGEEYHALHSAYWNEDANLRRVQMLWDSDWESLVLEIDGAVETHIIVAAEDEADARSLLEEYCRLSGYTE